MSSMSYIYRSFIIFLFFFSFIWSLGLYTHAHILRADDLQKGTPKIQTRRFFFDFFYLHQILLKMKHHIGGRLSG